MMENTIEKYVSLLARPYSAFQLYVEDEVFIRSVAKQIGRGVAMTDRQYEVVKQKIVKYRDQFESNGVNDLDEAIERVSMPLRTVDRTRSVTVKDGEIVVRFPFDKRLVARLEEIAKRYAHVYCHQKGTNEHRFRAYESVIEEVMSLFKNKNFEIDESILECLKEIEAVKSDPGAYVPRIVDNTLVCVSPKVEEMARRELDEFTDETAIKYWDRAIRYGYERPQRIFRRNSELADMMANRSRAQMYLSPSRFDVCQIAGAIRELDRFPLLVTLSSGKQLNEIEQLIDAFDWVRPEEQILLSRLSDNSDPNFKINRIPKDRNFSRWLDSSTKIVYIFKTNLPKLLIKNEWRPIAHLSLTSERDNPLVQTYVNEHCDLNLFHDDQPNLWTSSILKQLVKW